MRSTKKRLLIFIAIFVIWGVLGFVPMWLKTDVKMFGADGLQKLVLHIVVDEFRALLLFSYFFISGMSDVIKSGKAKDRPRFIRSLVSLIVFPVLLYIVSGKPSLNEQYRIRNIGTPFPDVVLGAECIRDLNEDVYDEYLANGCKLNTTKQGRLFSFGSRTEYTADFTYNGQTVVSAQIGYYQYRLLKDVMPINDDTAVKIYRNSGFVRNVTPLDNG